MNAPRKSKCGWAMTRESAAVLLALAMVCGSVSSAQGEGKFPAAPSGQGGKSADEIAKELSNWLIKFTATPVVQNKLADWFK